MITINNYLIPECKNCEYYNHEENRPRNRLRCMLDCDGYQQDQAQRMYSYNMLVSGEDFTKEEMYEHGLKVFGSGKSS